MDPVGCAVADNAKDMVAAGEEERHNQVARDNPSVVDEAVDDHTKAVDAAILVEDLAVKAVGIAVAVGDAGQKVVVEYAMRGHSRTVAASMIAQVLSAAHSCSPAAFVVAGVKRNKPVPPAANVSAAHSKFELTDLHSWMVRIPFPARSYSVPQAVFVVAGSKRKELAHQTAPAFVAPVVDSNSDVLGLRSKTAGVASHTVDHIVAWTELAADESALDTNRFQTRDGFVRLSRTQTRDRLYLAVSQACQVDSPHGNPPAR